MKKTYLFVALLVSIIITSTLIVFVVSYTYTKEQKRIFELETKVIDRIFSKKVRLLENVLKNFQILFHTVEDVDADMFNLFSNEVLSKYKNIDSFSYSPIINHSERNEFVEDRRDWGYFDYSIKTYDSENKKNNKKEYEKYLPIMYLEPFTPKKSLLFGNDLYNDPQNKKSIEISIKTGRISVSKEENGYFYLFIPTYNGKFVPLTEEERIKKFNGIVSLKIFSDTTPTVLNIKDDMNFRFEVIHDDKKNIIFEKVVEYKSAIFRILNLEKNREFDLDGVDINLNFSKKFYFNDLDAKYIYISLFIFLLVIFSTYHFVKKHFELKEEIAEKLKKEKEVIEANNLLGQQSKLASMGEMIMNIAHQWRQPLTVVSGNLVLIELLHERGKLSEEKLRDKIGESTKQIEFMSKTIDDFRDFFKPDKSKEIFSIEEAIENTINLIKSTFKKLEIEIEKDIDSSLKVDSFKSEFSQVVLNLLNNSKDASISNEVEKPLIKVSVKSSEENVVIKVSDNAGGIKVDPIEKIFEPYVSTKHQSTGTGIGLYMCMMIIEKNMHGRLEVENIENGACFTITLKTIKE